MPPEIDPTKSKPAAHDAANDKRQAGGGSGAAGGGQGSAVPAFFVALLIPLAAVFVAIVIRIVVLDQAKFAKDPDTFPQYVVDSYLWPVWIDFLVAASVLWVGAMSRSTATSNKLLAPFGVLFALGLGSFICAMLPMMKVTEPFITHVLPIILSSLAMVILAGWTAKVKA